jgi:hypothetical protein
MVTVLLLVAAAVLIGEDTRAMTAGMELINGAGEGVETQAVELNEAVGGDLHRLLETRTLACRSTRDPWMSFSVGSTATAQGRYSSASSALDFAIHASLFAALATANLRGGRREALCGCCFCLRTPRKGATREEQRWKRR